MDTTAPTAAEFEELARELRKRAAATNPEKAQGLITQFSAALLSIGNTLTGNGHDAVMQLHKEFVQEAAAPAIEDVSFVDLFSGRGQLAKYLRSKFDFSAVRNLYPEISTSPEIATVVNRDVNEFDFGLYEDDAELKSMLAFMHELQENAPRMMPYSFLECNIQGGFEAVLKANTMDNIVAQCPSGFYDDVARKMLPDGSMPWIMFLKINVFPKGKYPLKMIFILRQGHECQLFLRHPLEAFWCEWDKKSLINHMVPALLQEYALHSLTLLRPRAVNWDFQKEVDDLIDKNRAYLWQHEVLPPRTLFYRNADAPHQVFADFMWGLNNACLTVIGAEVCMVFYCTKSNGNWNQRVLFIRPQQSIHGPMLVVDPKSLSEQQQRTLVQRAAYAIVLKNRTIYQHQQKEKETA